jgi:ABC-2 type transport system permease protein
MGMLSNRQHDLAFWENYIRFMPGIDLRYINYYDTVNNDYIFGNPVYRKMKLDSIAMRVAAGRNWDLDNFLSPVQIHKIINLAPEGNYFVRQIEYGNKATFLRMFHDVIQDPSEKEITTAFKRLIADPPVIAFLSGHNERSINKGGEKGYETFFSSLKERSSLINQGFDITTVFPDQKIPANIASLVIADPTTAFSPAEIQNIQNYLRGGGNALIAGDKDRQAILNPVVSMLGVRFTDGSLVENHMEFSPGLVFPKFTENVAMYHYFFENNQEIAMPGAVGLQYKKNDLYDIEPVLTTDEKNIWNKKAPFKLDTGKVAYEPSKGDDNRTLPVALQLTRKAGDKQQRIIILGDADFMDNGTVRKEFKGESTANGDFATDIFKWFSYGQFPLDLPRPAPIDNKLLLTPQGLYILKIIFLALLPGLLLLGGIVLLISRRRK